MSTHSRNDSALILYFFIHPPPFSLARSSLRIAGITLPNCTIYYLPGPTHPPTHPLRPTDLPTLRPYSWSPNDESLPFSSPCTFITTITKTERERERDGFSFLSPLIRLFISDCILHLHFYFDPFFLVLRRLLDCWFGKQE